MNVDPRLVGAILRSDFYSFIRAIFPIVSSNDAFAPNWHIEAIAYQLTRVLKGEIRRLIITVPPRSLKSICASVAFPAFILGHDPQRKIICVSYSEGLARKHANDCRAVMRSDMYRRVFPKTRISPRKDTELEFACTLGGYRLATSVGGTLTGRGGNFIIIDDPMKPQDAVSEAARETTKQWYSNTLLTRLDNKVADAIVVVMQRLHQDDLVGYLLERLLAGPIEDEPPARSREQGKDHGMLAQKISLEDLTRVAIQLEHARIQRQDAFRRGVGRAGGGATGDRLHIGRQVLSVCR